MARARRRPPAPRFLSLGWQVIEWAETFLCHGPGDVQGAPLRLTDEQAAFVLRCYQLREDGSRVVRRAALSRPKGWAKTELGGVLQCCELLGPVRFDGWDANGEPVGRPVVAARCSAYATEEGQAGETYAAAAYMLEHGAAYDEYRLDVGLGRTFVAGGGQLMPRVSAPTSADGGKETFATFDETHLYVTPRLHDLHAVVRRNLGKRAASEPWSLETSTMFRPGDGSVAEALFRYWLQLVAGEYGDPVDAIARAGLLVDHLEGLAIAGRLEDASDDELEAALRVGYGDAAEFVDFARIIGEIRDPQTDEADNRRYWLNQAVRGDTAWLDESELELFDELAVDLADDEPAAAPGTPIVLGFDGSLSDDATVLRGCTLGRDGKPRLFTLGVWEIDPLATARERAEWVVDREDVLDAVDEAFETFDVLLFYADPPYWSPEIAAWASRYGDDVVREFPTFRDYRMGPAQDALRVAIVTGELEHDGDARVRRHYANAHRRRTRHGTTIAKDRPGSPHKIDAAVTDAIAFAARNDAIAENLDQRRRRRRRRGNTPRKGGELHVF